jgi:hypothetical protein
LIKELITCTKLKTKIAQQHNQVATFLGDEVEELGAVGASGAGGRRRRPAGCRAAGADLVLLLLRPC